MSLRLGDKLIASNLNTTDIYNKLSNLDNNKANKDSVDGQWNGGLYALAVNLNVTANMVIDYDLSSYIPNDGYNYEILIDGLIHTGSATGNYSIISIKTTLLEGYAQICSARTRAASSVLATGTAIIPIGIDRILTFKHEAVGTGRMNLYVMKYRRLGTNV